MNLSNQSGGNMKAIVCEMCGSHQMVKNGGYYICESCGTKYSAEEAKKLMVEVQGSVSVDKSNELKSLWTLARRARTERNYESAERYYSQILSIDPNSWEANLLSTVYSAMNSSKPYNGVRAICGSIVTSLNMLKSSVDPSNYGEMLNLVLNELYAPATVIFDIASTEFTDAVNDNIAAGRGGNSEQKLQNLRAGVERLKFASSVFDSSIDILYTYGDNVIKIFGEKYSSYTVAAYKRCVDMYARIHRAPGQKYIRESLNDQMLGVIKKYDPSYVQPKNSSPSGGGCYVATAVYGSYDCPQVWTLRRYRDYTLAESWYGRAFIRTYYAISPTLVRWFGHTNWFKKMWRGRLDRMVSKLNTEGVMDTPYEDRRW